MALVEHSRARDERMAPGRALRLFMEDFVTHTNVYRGLASSLGAVLKCGTPGGHAINAEGKRLVRRAHAAKVVRRDASFDDLVCVVAAIALVTQNAAPKTRVAHLVDVFIDGIVAR